VRSVFSEEKKFSIAALSQTFTGAAHAAGTVAAIFREAPSAYGGLGQILLDRGRGGVTVRGRPPTGWRSDLA